MTLYALVSYKTYDTCDSSRGYFNSNFIIGLFETEEAAQKAASIINRTKHPVVQTVKVMSIETNKVYDMADDRNVLFKERD